MIAFAFVSICIMLCSDIVALFVCLFGLHQMRWRLGEFEGLIPVAFGGQIDIG